VYKFFLILYIFRNINLAINYTYLRVYNDQVYYNILLSYHSNVQNLDQDRTPSVQVGITATIAVNFTKFQIIKITDSSYEKY